MFWADIWKISDFLSENFHFLVVKFSIHLNRLVFVMESKFSHVPAHFRLLWAYSLQNLLRISRTEHNRLCACAVWSMAYSIRSNDVNITKTCLFKYPENFTTKKWKFSDKNSDSFHISAQTIDCGYSLESPRWASSNEYPQPMFLSRNKKNNVYPCKPQFYYIKVGFKGVKII